MMKDLVTFFVGVMFAMGFGLAGVTRPATIVNFLDFTGRWDPTVMLVMGAAVVTTFTAYRLMFRRNKPVLAPVFSIPTRRDIDSRLLVGSAIFGAGWGLVGLCPGPALSSLTGASAPTVVVFLGALIGGMLLFKGWDSAMALRAQRALAQA